MLQLLLSVFLVSGIIDGSLSAYYDVGDKYLISKPGKLSQGAAVQFCDGLNYHLVDIDSPAKYEEVKQWVHNNFNAVLNKGGVFWTNMAVFPYAGIGQFPLMSDGSTGTYNTWTQKARLNLPVGSNKLYVLIQLNAGKGVAYNGLWNAAEGYRTRALCERNPDVDECVLGTDNCHAHASCINTDGSFTCKCNDGYHGNGVQCSDVDECVLGTDNCHAHARCINTDGSFNCKCNDGFQGNGVQCSAIPCYGKPVDFRAREPDGSKSMGHFAYELTDKHLNWHEAKAACKSKGGWLAWIGIRNQPGWSTAAKKEHVLTKLGMGMPDSAWIGLSWGQTNVGQTASRWNWEDGRPANTDEVALVHGEHDHGFGYCAYIYSYKGLAPQGHQQNYPTEHWHQCSKKFRGVCEFWCGE